MKLTQNQIEELFKFTRAHYVEYYDLQLELVDHLANGIEKQWEENPGLTFEEAKNREFKKFGVFGFQDVINERRKAMSKKYRGIIWGHFKEWWSLPRIIATLTFVMVIFTMLKMLPPGELKKGIVSGIFIGFSLVMLFRTFQLKKRMEGAWRKWMLQEIIYNQGLLVNLFTIPMNLLNLTWTNDFMDNLYFQLALSLLIVSMGLLLKICGYVIPSKADEILAETYSEYKIS
ncbi:hypothetical protein [Maribacter flavus]|uniref:Uncharacterized protein n=1 Tax=Maribacter flavus TaxID=1658664 RepID=A0A5B2TY12_9FLAO|nr:hypothetical protein [Maribacter flavus]KAA2219224.1 hypothetical protein F0361_06330 [Maribacter flavus]